MVIVRALARALEPPAALMYWSTIFWGSWAGARAAKTIRQNAAAMASLQGCMALKYMNADRREKFPLIFKIAQACPESSRRTRTEPGVCRSRALITIWGA